MRSMRQTSGGITDPSPLGPQDLMGRLEFGQNIRKLCSGSGRAQTHQRDKAL